LREDASEAICIILQLLIIQCELPAVPVITKSTGLYDVDYRIVVACRDGNIYTIKVFPY
jgi:hypothetical protein